MFTFYSLTSGNYVYETSDLNEALCIIKGQKPHMDAIVTAAERRIPFLVTGSLTVHGEEKDLLTLMLNA